MASGDLTLDRSFGQQKVRGFEGGIKLRAMDGRFRGSLIGYRYVNPGLQVTANIIDPVRGVDQRIVNAGKATNKGASSWRAISSQATPSRSTARSRTTGGAMTGW